MSFFDIILLIIVRKATLNDLIICAGNGENFDFAKNIGVGLINSAINLTNLLKIYEISSNLPRKIIFIGTAGLYKNGEILEIYESCVASNLEISSLLNLAYTPINTDFKSNVSYETLKVNSSNFITTDEKIAFKFYENGYFMENMEFYSVLKVAEFFQISAYGIFCATNFCNQFAHDDFAKNHEKAKLKLRKYVREKGLV